eukprot:tig00001214_g7557.t1
MQLDSSQATFSSELRKLLDPVNAPVKFQVPKKWKKKKRGVGEPVESLPRESLEARWRETFSVEDRGGRLGMNGGRLQYGREREVNQFRKETKASLMQKRVVPEEYKETVEGYKRTLAEDERRGIAESSYYGGRPGSPLRGVGGSRPVTPQSENVFTLPAENGHGRQDANIAAAMREARERERALQEKLYAAKLKAIRFGPEEGYAAAPSLPFGPSVKFFHVLVPKRRKARDEDGAPAPGALARPASIAEALGGSRAGGSAARAGPPASVARGVPGSVVRGSPGPAPEDGGGGEREEGGAGEEEEGEEAGPPAAAGNLRTGGVRVLIPDTIVVGEPEVDSSLWYFTSLQDGRVCCFDVRAEREILRQLGRPQAPGEPVALVKRLDPRGACNRVEVLDTAGLDAFVKTSMSAGVPFLIQRFVRPGGQRPYIVRAHWRAGLPTIAYVISSRRSFEEAARGPGEASLKQRYCVDVDAGPAATSVVQVPAGGGASGWAPAGEISSELARHIERSARPGVRLEELVLDFVRDAAGRWWLLQCKAFRASALPRAPGSPDPDDPDEPPRAARALQRSASAGAARGGAKEVCAGDYCRGVPPDDPFLASLYAADVPGPTAARETKFAALMRASGLGHMVSQGSGPHRGKAPRDDSDSSVRPAVEAGLVEEADYERGLRARVAAAGRPEYAVAYRSIVLDRRERRDADAARARSPERPAAPSSSRSPDRPATAAASAAARRASVLASGGDGRGRAGGGGGRAAGGAGRRRRRRGRRRRRRRREERASRASLSRAASAAPSRRSAARPSTAPAGGAPSRRRPRRPSRPGRTPRRRGAFGGGARGGGPLGGRLGARPRGLRVGPSLGHPAGRSRLDPAVQRAERPTASASSLRKRFAYALMNPVDAREAQRLGLAPAEAAARRPLGDVLLSDGHPHSPGAALYPRGARSQSASGSASGSRLGPRPATASGALVVRHTRPEPQPHGPPSGPPPLHLLHPPHPGPRHGPLAGGGAAAAVGLGGGVAGAGRGASRGASRASEAASSAWADEMELAARSHPPRAPAPAPHPAPPAHASDGSPTAASEKRAPLEHSGSVNRTLDNTSNVLSELDAMLAQLSHDLTSSSLA